MAFSTYAENYELNVRSPSFRIKVYTPEKNDQGIVQSLSGIICDKSQRMLLIPAIVIMIRSSTPRSVATSWNLKKKRKQNEDKRPKGAKPKEQSIIFQSTIMLDHATFELENSESSVHTITVCQAGAPDEDIKAK